MKNIDLLVTDDQFQALREVAVPEGLMVDEWVLEIALSVSVMAQGTREAFLRRSPRRDPGARAPVMPPTMVRCRHCGIKTRRVATCDNCDEEL